MKNRICKMGNALLLTQKNLIKTWQMYGFLINQSDLGIN